MNELFRTFNPHEETTRAAREWNQGPSYEDIFRPQLDRRGITNANVDDRPLFKNAALGAAPYDNQHELTSIENPTNSPYFRDFVTAVARNRGTAQNLYDMENLPWEEAGYEQFAGQNVPPLMPLMPRFTGPETWRDPENFKVGADLNIPVFGGELLLDYKVSPDNIYDMTHPFQGDADWNTRLKYVKRF